MNETVEYIDDVGGLYFRAILLPNTGDRVPQHTHDHEHVTLIAAGAARLYVDGVRREDIRAFRAIVIEANRQHMFEALEPNTRLACVHQLNGEPYRLIKEV